MTDEWRTELKQKLPIALIIILSLALLFLGFLYYQERNAAADNKREGEQTLTDLSKILYFSPDEKPTVVTIIDKEKLTKSNPDFYKNAENGDKMILFSDRAVIYRDKVHQIINVAPIITATPTVLPTSRL